jgi:hypothetical protein
MTKSIGLWASLALILVVGGAASVAMVNYDQFTGGGCSGAVCPSQIQSYSESPCCSAKAVPVACPSVCPSECTETCDKCPTTDTNGQTSSTKESDE